MARSPHFPISFYHGMSIDHFQDPLQRTPQTLVKPVSISQDFIHALQQDMPIVRAPNKLTITPHVTPSSLNANQSAILLGTWPCLRLSTLRVCL